jgi:hypothetical protein
MKTSHGMAAAISVGIEEEEGSRRKDGGNMAKRSSIGVACRRISGVKKIENEIISGISKISIS